jgi:phosphoenolpyruvate carboxylase
MKNYAAFTEQVAMKFQIYNGLFLNLPFPDVKSSGILLPVFTSFCQTGLEEEGRSPLELVEEFFHRRVGAESFREVKTICSAFFDWLNVKWFCSMRLRMRLSPASSTSRAPDP